MKKQSKALGAGIGGGLGPIIAAAIESQFPTITPEMSVLIGVVAAAILGYAGAYIAPKNTE